MPVLLAPVVSGAQVKASDINQYLTCVVASSYLMSGSTPSVPASLTLTYGVQQATILDAGANAAFFVYLAAGSATFGANQDIYVDLGYSGGYNGSAANGTLVMVAGANGFTPSATPSGQMRLWKVVTGASAITSVTLLAPTVALPASAGVANGVAGLDGSGSLVAGQQRGVLQVVYCTQTTDFNLTAVGADTAYAPTFSPSPAITTLAPSSRLRIRWTTGLEGLATTIISTQFMVAIDGGTHHVIGERHCELNKRTMFSGVWVTGALAAGTHSIALWYWLDNNSGGGVVINPGSESTRYHPVLEIEEIV